MLKFLLSVNCFADNGYIDGGEIDLFLVDLLAAKDLDVSTKCRSHLKLADRGETYK